MGTKPQQKAQQIDEKPSVGHNQIVTKPIPQKKAPATLVKVVEHHDVIKVAWTTAELAAKIIIAHEWKLHTCAFYDHTRWSIGYGTKSYKGECISEKEALLRFEEALGWRLAQVERDYPTLVNYQHAALVSLYYNCNSCYLNAWGRIEKNDFVRWRMKWTKYWSWLLKRANNERALFTKGVIY